MQTFCKWLEEHHPEIIQEGPIWDATKKWGQKATLGGALLGAGMGIGSQFGGQQAPETWTVPNAGSYLNNQAQSQRKHPLGSFYQKQREHERARNQQKADALRKAG